MTAKFLAATATGDAPDLIWCARDELCGVLDAGALEPLESLTIDESNKYLEVMVEAFNNGWFVSNAQTYSGWKINLNKCIQAVIGADTDPMETLEDAAEQFNTANNR